MANRPYILVYKDPLPTCLFLVFVPSILTSKWTRHKVLVELEASRHNANDARRAGRHPSAEDGGWNQWSQEFGCMIFWVEMFMDVNTNSSGQILVTSHDLSLQNVVFWKKIVYFRESRLVKYDILPRTEG